MTVSEEIAAERRRQIEVEGHDTEFDDEMWIHGELARAAACYAMGAAVDNSDRSAMDQVGTEGTPSSIWSIWPWTRKWHKPKSRRHDLILAAALIVAEIDRLDRAAEGETE